jgi:uncharacterized membrane protein
MEEVTPENQETEETERHSRFYQHRHASVGITQQDVSHSTDQIDFEEKAFAALSYVWIMFLVPLILKRDSKFIVFHVKQGLILFIAEILAWIVLWVLGEIVSAVAPISGFALIQLLDKIVFLFFFIVSLIAIYQTFRKKEWKMPWLYNFAKLIRM